MDGLLIDRRVVGLNSLDSRVTTFEGLPVPGRDGETGFLPSLMDLVSFEYMLLIEPFLDRLSSSADGPFL
jgi:hypothetical protein